MILLDIWRLANRTYPVYRTVFFIGNVQLDGLAGNITRGPDRSYWVFSHTLRPI